MVGRGKRESRWGAAAGQDRSAGRSLCFLGHLLQPVFCDLLHQPLGSIAGVEIVVRKYYRRNRLSHTRMVIGKAALTTVNIQIPGKVAKANSTS